MAIASTKLEDFFKMYLENRNRENDPYTYENYKRQRGSTYDTDYYSALTSAMAENRGREHGQASEKLAERGLLGGGYAEHLGSLEGVSYDTRKAALTKERDRRAAGERRGYLRYLDSYNRNQDRIRQNVVKLLIEEEQTDANEIYRYAVEAGLNSTTARSIISSVRTVTRDKVRTRILEDVYAYKITPAAAEARAKEFGLDNEDILYIKKATEKFKIEYQNFSNSYLEFLEDQANKTTYSYEKKN